MDFNELRNQVFQVQLRVPTNIATLLQSQSRGRLAKGINVNYTTVWRWQTGRSKPDIATAMALEELAARELKKAAEAKVGKGH